MNILICFVTLSNAGGSDLICTDFATVLLKSYRREMNILICFVMLSNAGGSDLICTDFATVLLKFYTQYHEYSTK